jgi:hypothetical protein
MNVGLFAQHLVTRDSSTHKGTSMIPFVIFSDKRGQKISVNAELVQFVRLADNSDDECLIIFGKDQLLRVRGSLEEITEILRDA